MAFMKPGITWINIATEGMDPELEQKKKLKNQIASLRSGNKTAILVTLKEIRREGDVSILPELFDLLMDQEDDQILTETCSLLNDLKDQQAAAILGAAITDPEYKGITRMLVAACWQNGLSYGKYLDQFVRVAIDEDYATAIEAFTVIEGAIGEVEQEERKRSIELIQAHLPHSDNQKKPLLRELVKVISEY
jgi:hypothetical protein